MFHFTCTIPVFIPGLFTWIYKCHRSIVSWRRHSVNWDGREGVKWSARLWPCCGRVHRRSWFTMPVHDVGGERSGETEQVEAELCGRAESQARHDGEQREVHPQACMTRRVGQCSMKMRIGAVLPESYIFKIILTKFVNIIFFFPPSGVNRFDLPLKFGLISSCWLTRVQHYIST